ncbi:MAG: glycine--tRNA ligase subunit beta [Desulfohalobiaceae bacterium]|nr:glycine--tRNA ligase subunit beta [Desulfohalobiaceae bacterium]
MAHFVFEIGMEELPAGFLPGLEDKSFELFSELFEANYIPFSGIEVVSTPRRLVVDVSEISPSQNRREEVLIGPPKNRAYDEQGNLTRAGQGFLRSQAVQEEELFIKSTDRGEYLAVLKSLGGADTLSQLPGICAEVIKRLPLPKKMRWESSGFSFGRPIRWLLALLDETVVPVSIASKTAGRMTFGHRVLGPGPFEVPEAGSYFDIIKEKGKVILGIQNRAERVLKQGQELADAKKGQVVWKEDLLQEVSCLVEYPKPVLGEFSREYLQLPRQVLLTCMESHQKCFGIEDEQGRLLPFFLTTLNLEPEDLELVKTGWERVLRARLEDAAFFWKADSGASLDQWGEKLNKVVFLGPLGNMGDKTRRLVRISGFLADRLAPDSKNELSRAARLAKTDLVSEMVGEFASLQGIMGSIYAGQKGESKTVSQAIYEHYLPSGHESLVPETLTGSLLSIADKLDNLTGCFGLNMIPTGTQDPYALRRQALGIVRIILEHGLRLSLPAAIKEAQNAYGDTDWKLDPKQSAQRLLDFFRQRVRIYFIEKGYNTLVVDAVVGTGIDDIRSLEKRLLALDEFSREKEFEQAILTFKRAANIIRKQGGPAGNSLSGVFDSSLLIEPQEKALAKRLEELAPEWERLWQEEEFHRLFALLWDLRPVVDGFFDHVMVMAEDQDLRLNRLNMLKSLVDRLNHLADFSALQI